MSASPEYILERSLAPPPLDIPDPPSTAAGLRDRNAWTEIVIEPLGRIYVIAYDAAAQVAAVWDHPNGRWLTIHRCTPDMAEQLPERLVREFVSEVQDTPHE
ncbi:MAG: hypothetical protein IT483_15430 [Gammaproteobacteria bacterium]|nr:hypothetical protein [Gammaproteobacteria bacterium]